MNVLFGSKGRITPNQFWQGIIILVGLQILLYLGMAYVSIFLIFVYLLLLYPYICVYAKRLHDGAKSGWLFMAFFVGAIVVSLVIDLLTGGFSGIDEAAIQVEAEELMAAGDMEGVIALYQRMIKTDLVLSIVNLVILNLVIGFFAARIVSDPHTNQYGPPVGGEAEGTSDDNDIFS